MRRFQGNGTGTGIAIGPARLLAPRIEIEERSIEQDGVVAEVDRLDAALQSADAAMERIGVATDAPAEAGAEMVDAHRAILKSDEMAHGARRVIRERRVGAEWAVRLVVEEMRSVFDAMPDERFRARFEDVEAVAERLVRTLLELPEARPSEGMAGGIAIGLELSPLDALELHRLGVAGLATEHGGPTSHAAIVARALGIPYAFGVHGLVGAVRPNALVCVDGDDGTVVTSPSAEVARAFEARRADDEARRRAVESTRHEAAVTLDDVAVSLGANVESAGELSAALEAGADHIGLVRTELLYLDRRQLPSEEEQLADAIEMVRAARGRLVTFRTLDLGGDKLPAGIHLDIGPNPALGLRGIRLSLRRQELFSTQLRALYRAAASGPVRILLPLVATVDELREAREICREVCAGLAAARVPHDPRVPIGAMIETPSAVLTVDELAAGCDFLSVGTNDLLQYAFAADRQNEEVALLYRPVHPAMLRALRLVFSAAERHERPVSVCGDMAGDPACTWILLGLGLRSFSMNARALPFVKSVVRKTELARAAALAREALLLSSDAEVEALARARMGGQFTLELGDHSPTTA